MAAAKSLRKKIETRQSAKTAINLGANAGVMKININI